jgi:hypothetical protein
MRAGDPSAKLGVSRHVNSPNNNVAHIARAGAKRKCATHTDNTRIRIRVTVI